jgi:hypothetical protein
MERHEDDFKVFLILDEDDEDATDFESYISAMREDGEWGGNLELVAAARHYRYVEMTLLSNYLKIPLQTVFDIGAISWFSPQNKRPLQYPTQIRVAH